MNMPEFEVKIKGTSPLLQHRFPVEESDVKSKRRSGSIDYTKEAEKSLYKSKDGMIFEPSSHIEGSMIKAATSFQIPGKGKKTFKDMFRAAVFVEPMEIPIEPQSYEIDIQPVVVNRARVRRHRPRFDEWNLNFKIISLEEEQLDGATIQRILEHAGKFCGLGDWRPKYGRFEVVQFKKIGD